MKTSSRLQSQRAHTQVLLPSTMQRVLTMPRRNLVASLVLVALFDTCAALFWALAINAATPNQAYGYVDPSVMTYTIQALAGVVVALSTVFGVAWRRSRKKLMRLLGIDENANKTIEPEIHRISPSDGSDVSGNASTQDVSIAEETPKRRKTQDGYKIAWPHRLGYALLFASLFVITLFIVPPFEVLITNADSLFFGIQDIWFAIALPMVICALLAGSLISLAKGKPFHIIVCILFSLAVAAYVQAMLLNRGLPEANGTTVDWAEHWKITVVSTVAWVAVIVAAFVLMRKHPMAWRRIAAVVAIALVLAQGAELTALLMSNKASASEGTAEEESYVTEEGLFTVSPNENIIYLILDAYDFRYAEELLANNPEYFSELEDFTYYHDATGTSIPTRYAIPSLLASRIPNSETELKYYFETMYDGNTPIDRLADNDYSIGIYSDASFLDTPLECTQSLASRTVNIHPISSKSPDYQASFWILEKCAMYREMPWLLKPLFWYYTSDIDNKMVSNASTNSPSTTPYLVNDPQYYTKLKESGLSLEKDSNGGAFRFIHLQGPHAPYHMDENCNYVDESTVEQQTRGSMVIVSEYLKQLKELGVYDNATVIITADHGVVSESVTGIYDYWETGLPNAATCPVIFYKPPKNDGSPRRALKITESPVSALDIAPSYLKDAGLDYSAYGIPLSENNDPLRPRYFDMLFLYDSKTKEYIVQYCIEGFAGDLNNWHTEKVMTQVFEG